MNYPTMKALYYGNISSEQLSVPPEESKHFRQAILDGYTDLEKHFNKEQLEEIDKFVRLNLNLSCLEQEHTFFHGLTIGASFILEMCQFQQMEGVSR